MTCARQARHHRAHRHVKPRGDLVIAETFEIAENHDIPDGRRQGIERIGKHQPVNFHVFFCTVVRQVCGEVKVKKGKRVAMAKMVGVDVHHDRIEPAAEIVAMPLAFMGQRAFDRILQQVGAVFG
ncbi:hypothetical protein ABID12_001863 [Martelella mangrovi]|uniref:Uncharacterized protein n=1 Tax=Martelella mangrovi TaxID=1397477 RepID=A0ABV2IAI1_9HYPH